MLRILSLCVFLLAGSMVWGQTIYQDGSLTIEGTLNFCGTDTGSVNAFTCANPAGATIAAYHLGSTYSFKASHANTGVATLAIDGLSAITIKKQGGAADLASGDIASGSIVRVQYDGTNFQIESHLANQSGASTVYRIIGVFPSAGCSVSASGSSLDLPATNSPTPNCYGTSLRLGALDFSNAGTQNAFVHFTLPSDWQSAQAVDVLLKWFSSATSSSTTWSAQSFCSTDSSTVLTGTVTLNTAGTVTTSNPTTASTPISSSLAGISTTGCTAGSEMWVNVKRTDTNTGTSSLLTANVAIRRLLQ